MGAFDFDAKLELDADFLEEESPFEWGGVYHLEVGEYRFHFKPGADREMDFVLLPIASGSDEEFEIARRHASGRFTGGSRKIPVVMASRQVLNCRALYSGATAATTPCMFPGLMRTDSSRSTFQPNSR